MQVHTDTIYRSEEQFHVRYVDGERKKEKYFLYYLFRPDGVWLSRTTDDPRMDWEEFMVPIDLAEVLAEPHHDEPLNSQSELVYQCGTYSLADDTVYLKWKHSQLDDEERNWYFRIREADLLETDMGEYQLRPVNRS